MFPPTLESVPNGAGSILSGMISAMGIKSTPNCSCKRHALEMNTNGPDWCEENLGTILDWLNEEAQKRFISVTLKKGKKKIKITIPSFWHISLSASYQLEREGKDRE